jgi:hypothetical protein
MRSAMGWISNRTVRVQWGCASVCSRSCMSPSARSYERAFDPARRLGMAGSCARACERAGCPDGGVGRHGQVTHRRGGAPINMAGARVQLSCLTSSIGWDGGTREGGCAGGAWRGGQVDAL